MTSTCRSIFILGAAGDIGSATCALALAKGYSVVASVRDEREADRLRGRLGQDIPIVLADLANAEALRPAAESVFADRDFDAVLHCAGIAPFGPMEIAATDRFRLAFEINVVSAQVLYQLAMPSLRGRTGASSVIGSMLGLVHVPFLGHYVATKHALEGLVDVMRLEASKWGVEVVLVEFGRVRTNIGQSQLEAIASEQAALTALGAGALQRTL